MNENLSCPRQQGFSLLEILVAFSILALSLGILLNIFSSGLRSAVISDEYIHAVTIAESKLAATGVESLLQEGDSYGEEDKYSWKIVVSPYYGELIDPENLSVTPYKITVEVAWQEGKEHRTVVLNTLRLAQES